jgi:hypothetical protein
VRNAFRISTSTDVACSFVLQANDDLDKRHWIQCIRDALLRQDAEHAATAAAVYDDCSLSHHRSPALSNYVPVVRRRTKLEMPSTCPPETQLLPLPTSQCPNGSSSFTEASGDLQTDLDNTELAEPGLSSSIVQF